MDFEGFSPSKQALSHDLTPHPGEDTSGKLVSVRHSDTPTEDLLFKKFIFEDLLIRI